MATLKRLSNIFYKVSKILLIIGIVAFAVLSVVFLIVGIVGVVNALNMTGSQDEIAAAVAAAIVALIFVPIVYLVLMVLSIVALALTKKAVNSDIVKRHILAAVFGVICGAGVFSLAAGIISTVFIKRGGKFGEDVAEAKAVEAKPAEEESK